MPPGILALFLALFSGLAPFSPQLSQPGSSNLASPAGNPGQGLTPALKPAAAVSAAEARPSTPPDIGGPAGENGITVGRTKVFDNRTLVLMLQTLSDTLKGLQVIDQDPLRKALGLLQGSQTQDVARSFSVLSGGTPKMVTTESSSTDTTTQDKTTTATGLKDDKDTKDYIEKLIDKTVTDKLGLNRETTVSERNPALPSLPDLIAAPSGAPAFGQNPLDLLTDQVNLTYQIFNVRMMLERSLSDRLLNDGNARLQTVLGFNVSIDPPRDAQDAAAVVEITITSENGPVSLVSLMPQEKTYNSVALSTKSNAFGGSAVGRMVTIGYSERRRGQIFYLYRDNDTLSFERMMTQNRQLTFGWQFRPVLGRRSVAAGMRQMFAVVSLPVSDSGDLISSDTRLSVRVRTYWRKYYAGTLTTSDRGGIGPWPYVKRVLSFGTAQTVPNGKVAWREETGGSDLVVVPTTAKYQSDLRPKVSDVRWSQVDDKTALISVEGENFFDGTTVALGGSAVPPTVIIKSTRAIDILTPIENIGVGNAMIIGRYGSAQPLEKNAGCSPQLLTGRTYLIEAFGGKRELHVGLGNCPVASLDQPLVIFAEGKHVPGELTYSEVPCKDTNEKDNSDQGAKKDCIEVVASIPVALIPKAGASITVVNPFRTHFRVQFPWYDNAYEVQRMPAGRQTIVYVRRIDRVSLFREDVFGKHPKWRFQFDGADKFPIFEGGAMRLELPADAEGSLALFEPSLSGEPNLYLLELPPAKPKPKAPVEPAPGTALLISQNDAPKLDFGGALIDTVASVRIEGRDPLKTEYDADKKVLSVYLSQEITKLAARVTLQFRDSGGKLVNALVLEVKARTDNGNKAPAARETPGTKEKT